MAAVNFAMRVARHAFFRGAGIFAGLPPDPNDPDSPDGRYRVLNEPGRGKIVVYERSSMIPVAATLSASDGTWEVAGLDAERTYLIIGFDGRGRQNAAIQDWVKPHVPE